MTVEHIRHSRNDFASMCFQRLDDESEVVVEWPHPAGHGVDHVQRKKCAHRTFWKFRWPIPMPYRPSLH